MLQNLGSLPPLSHNVSLRRPPPPLNAWRNLWMAPYIIKFVSIIKVTRSWRVWVVTWKQYYEGGDMLLWLVIYSDTRRKQYSRSHFSVNISKNMNSNGVSLQFVIFFCIFFKFHAIRKLHFLYITETEKKIACRDISPVRPKSTFIAYFCHLNHK